MSYNKISVQKYKRENREKVNEQNRKYRLENKDKVKAWYKKSMDISDFGGLRTQILLRDNWSCVFCGMENDTHIMKWGREITIDHIDGNRKNNTMSNLQTVCLCCHGKKDIKRRGAWAKLGNKTKQVILNNLKRRWSNG
jgi:hypothetical protein